MKIKVVDLAKYCKKGEWIENDEKWNSNLFFRNYMCSECRNITYFIRSNNKHFDYCPFCGSEMEESK